MTEVMVEKVSEGANGGVGAATTDRTPVNEVRFTLPSLPVTVNSLYQIRYSTREVFLRPECRRWKTDAKEHIPRFKLRTALSSVRADIVFHFPFLYRNGKPRILDAPNLLKLTIDAIAEKCGFNDYRVRLGSWDSVDSMDEKVEVRLLEIAQ